MEEQPKQQEDQDGAAKLHSIRVRDGVFERFKALAIPFDSQGDLFKVLVEFYENRMATENAGRQTEINNFEMHIGALLKAYNYSLDLNRDTEERIGGQYIDALKSKDATIFDLQQKADLLNSEINTLKSDNQALNTSVTTLEDESKSFSAKELAFISQLADKDKLIVSLEDKITTNNNTIASLVNEAETQKEALSELQNTIAECNRLSVDLAQAQNKITDIQRNCDAALHQADLSKKEALLDLQKTAYEDSKHYIDEIAELKNTVMELKMSIFEKTQPTP